VYLSEGSLPFEDLAERESGAGRPAWLEPLAIAIIAIAAILTAWTAFQHAKWSGVQASEFLQASSAGTAATQATTVASLDRTVDVGIFLQWLQSVRDDMDAGLADPAKGPYVADPNTLSGFIALRFRPEFKPAFDAWIASRPLLSSDRPSTPFELPQYSPQSDTDLGRWTQEAAIHAALAQEAIEHGEQYVLLTTLFAVALVLAGIGSKLRNAAASMAMLGIATLIIIGAAAALLTYPVEL
jgi:hypothetical protein